MRMTVIAMTRELGTLGADVAARVAGELGLEVVHDETIERHLAERLQTSEDAVRRLLTGEATIWERWKIGLRRVSHFTAEQVLLLARGDDVVIRGWGAAQLLNDVAHVICVRVCAPMPLRIERTRRRLGLADDAEARREIERSDEAHDRAVRGLDAGDWRDPTGYAAVLNTGQMTADTAAGLLLHLVRSRRDALTPESRQLLEDKLVRARVREALGAGGYGLDIQVEHGHVTLSGALIADASLEFLLDKARAVEGVKSIETDVHVVPFNLGA